MKRKIITSLNGAPEEALSIRCQMIRGQYPQFFLSDESTDKITGGRYLKKNEQQIARRIVQRDYDKKILILLEKQEKIIEAYLNNCGIDKLVNVYSKFPLAKRILLEPYVCTDEEFVKAWYECDKGNQNPYPIEKGFVTERGEMVRSKTEKMIADMLNYRGIPYKYEAPLKLKNNRIIYPDFTILNVRKRKIYYLEHFGMMDDPEYCKRAIEKIDEYEQSNIFLGEGLITTMESSIKAINLGKFEKTIEHYFM